MKSAAPRCTPRFSGNVHFLAANDAEAVHLVQRLLSFLPANNSEDPPHLLTADIDETADEQMTELIPRTAPAHWTRIS